jgi:alcohol dehydrogenase
VALDYADVNLVSIPEEIGDVEAASLGCRFITAFRAVVDQGKVEENQYVAVHGCGGVGLSAIQIASALGARVVAVDIRKEALELAREQGAFALVHAGKAGMVPEMVRELSGGGVHVSLDALGSSETCLNSIASLRKRGKHIQIGLMTGAHQAPAIPMDRVLAHELEILGSHGMQAHRYPEMLEMIRAGQLQPGRLVEKTISLEAAAKALPAMGNYPQCGIWVIHSFD